MHDIVDFADILDTCEVAGWGVTWDNWPDVDKAGTYVFDFSAPSPTGIENYMFNVVASSPSELITEIKNHCAEFSVDAHVEDVMKNTTDAKNYPASTLVESANGIKDMLTDLSADVGKLAITRGDDAR